ncbi:MAG TPA: hypothetical protein VFC19_08845, partial [Candidatus Limnocylindrales bacterium]|nr:hypothetical protein [Candidatus Limnocylindrales bacterium]
MNAGDRPVLFGRSCTAVRVAKASSASEGLSISAEGAQPAVHRLHFEGFRRELARIGQPQP